MERYDISDFFSAESHYRVTQFTFQRWNSEKYSYRDRPRPDHGFLFVTQGKIEFSSEVASIQASPGDMIFLPRGSFYEAIVRPEFGETKDYLINFEADPLSPDEFPKAPLCLFHAGHQEYVELFERTMDKTIKDQIGDFGMKGFLFTLLENMAKDGKNNYLSQMEIQLEKARKMLVERVDLSVSHVARSLGVSESGLRSHFKKAFGLSPVQYRMNIRINQAKHLLESTQMPVSDIAEALGFYDEAYFCKIFRKYTGLSPKKYSQNKKI